MFVLTYLKLAYQKKKNTKTKNQQQQTKSKNKQQQKTNKQTNKQTKHAKICLIVSS
jgi:hypothetical protein